MASSPENDESAVVDSVVVRRRRPAKGDAADDGVTADDSAAIVPSEEPATESPDSAEETVESSPASAPAAPAPAAADSLTQLLAKDASILADQAHSGSALDEGDLAAAVKQAQAPATLEEFATLLASHSGIEALKPGQRIKGTILSISDDVAFVDIGAKSEATIERRELLGDDGELVYEVGQELEAQVIKAGGDGVVQLSMGALKAQMLSELLESAVQSGLAVEGRVTGFNEGGLEVRVGGRRAFCPRSQIDTYGAGALEDYVGRDLSFVVTQYEASGRNLVLSRRQLLERQSKEMAASTMATLAVDAVVSGVVRKVMPFGAFVDLGGVDGLIHVSEISWSRVDDPAQVLSAGQQVTVKVLKIDSGKDRISLSLRQASDDPWDDIKTRYSEGGTYTGTVSRLVDFGAFVELEGGVEGLLHVSEIDWNKRIAHPSEALEVGQEITITVKEADAARKRLSLSMKRVGPDPWADMGKDIKVGSELEVTVEKVADFGVFCTIAPGLTGLLPTSHAVLRRNGNIRREFQPGKTVKVGVLALDRRARKVTLSQKALANSGGADDYRAYRKQVEKEQGEQPSALAFALAAAQQKGGKKAKGGKKK